MKIARIFALSLVLMIGVMLIHAQDDTLPDDTSGVIAHVIDSGTMIDNGDGTFLLTVSSPLDYAPSVITSAEFFRTFNYPLLELASDWEFAPDLEVPAVLDMGDVVLELVLTAPTIDPLTNEVTYLVVSATGLEEGKDGFELPEIEAGSLMINMDYTFVEGMIAGRTERINSTRWEGGGGW